MIHTVKNCDNQKARTDDDAKFAMPNGFMVERACMDAGLKKFGIDGTYVIVIADNPDIVERTAAEVLARFLRKAGLSAPIIPEALAGGQPRFVLGRETNLKLLRNLGDAGETEIRAISPEDDGFHLKQIGRDIIIAGANPRGVLYGVYAFEEYIGAGSAGGLNIKRVPRFRKRGSGPYYSFNDYVNLATEDFTEEKAAYLSRLGINQLTDQGVGGYLESFVHSGVFPFQTPPKPDFQRKVKAMSALCRKYGIEQYLFINAPAFPENLAAWEQYPPDTLGLVRRPWGGGQDGLQRTLCVSSPIVQAHLRDLMHKLVREYPDVKGMQFYNMDGESWLCTPELCDRCKTMCADSPPHAFNPWETQAMLLTLLAAAAHDENPDFDFRVWGAVHYHGGHFGKMIRAAHGFNSLLSCWNGGDRSVMIPDIAEPEPAFVISQSLCRERAVPFYMICECNNIESVSRSLPFPFHVCDTLQKINRWGVNNLTEIFGIIPEHNPINALVTKEFQTNPDQQPAEFLAGLAARQFGQTAGVWMYRAWEEMEQAFDTWNDMKFGPLDGSQHILSIGTAVALPPPILPDVVSRYDSILQILTNVEPWQAETYQKFKEPAFLDKMNRMSFHLAQARAHAQKAVTAANTTAFIGICYDEGPGGRPTCKEYAELNHASIALADVICRQRCNMLRAYHLCVEIDKRRAAGDEQQAAVKEAVYHALIREDLTVQIHFADMLLDFAGMRPCYKRTSLTEQELSDLLLATKAKIDMLTTYLQATGDAESDRQA